MDPCFMVLNAGSSSLKFAIFDEIDSDEPPVTVKGVFEELGRATRFVARDEDGTILDETSWRPEDQIRHEQALVHLVAWLRRNQAGHTLGAIAHRVVHGGEFFSGPVLVDDAVLETLESLIPLAPLHQPHNLEPIRIVRRRLPEVPQIACFDTAFHRTQPELAQMFALPHEVRHRGVRRYGFHGLSYQYIASALGRCHDGLARGRVVVAHLGNGASLCALKAGFSIATTMGFTALDGLPMGTRCGAIDPGVIFYMLREMGFTPASAERLLYTESGLLGVSGLSNDMRTLRSAAATNVEARRAIDLFVYRITREVGSLVAALGGIDGFVFTAGIGENDAATRAEIVSGLQWAGFVLEEVANRSGGPCISSGSGPAAWVIPTNEERVMAWQMRSALSAAPRRLAS